MRLRQGDTKGAVAAYERAAAESRTENAALLSGLTRVLTRDGRAQVRLDLLSAAWMVLSHCLGPGRWRVAEQLALLQW